MEVRQLVRQLCDELELSADWRVEDGQLTCDYVKIDSGWKYIIYRGVLIGFVSDDERSAIIDAASKRAEHEGMK